MATITFDGPFHDASKQKVRDALVGIFEEYPQARVHVVNTGDHRDPYFADMWDGPAHKTARKRISVYTLDVLANHVRWRLEEGSEWEGWQLRDAIQKDVDTALAAAPKESRRMRCKTCEKMRMCRARPSGLPFSPIMWVCRECWSYATETHA